MVKDNSINKLLVFLVNRAEKFYKESEESLNDTCSDMYEDSADEDLQTVKHTISIVFHNKRGAKNFQTDIDFLDSDCNLGVINADDDKLKKDFSLLRSDAKVASKPIAPVK